MSFDSAHANPAPDRRTRAAQRGFGVIELLVATLVLAFVMMGFALVFGSAARDGAKSGERTSAQQIATSELEKLRLMDYTQLGTTTGNPPGSVPATKTVGDFTVQTKITFVHDPVPGSFNTYQDYKAVRISVIVTRTNETIAVQETRIAPPGAPGHSEGVIKVTLVDKVTNTPVPGGTVTLSGGPGPSRSDTSDAAGEVIFPGLNPNASTGNPYDVTVNVPGGYVPISSDVPPFANASVRVAAASVQSLAIRLVKPVPVTSSFVMESGNTPIAAPVELFMASDDLVPSVGYETLTGPTVTRMTVGGEPVLPSTNYVFSARRMLTGNSGLFAKREQLTTPADASNPAALVVPDLKFKPYSTGLLRVTVRRGGIALKDAFVKVTDGPADMSMVFQTDASGLVAQQLPCTSGPGCSSGTYTLAVTDPMSGTTTPVVITTGLLSSTTSQIINLP